MKHKMKRCSVVETSSIFRVISVQKLDYFLSFTLGKYSVQRGPQLIAQALTILRYEKCIVGRRVRDPGPYSIPFFFNRHTVYTYGI